VSHYTATYSPEDNKLRLYALSRLPAEVYARVKAAGFKWAAKQQLFVAPMWTPDRADLLTELCGEIGDEDTSLVERAEERAERFEDYGNNRTEDAHRAREQVEQIGQRFELGQPILVGHHSEKRARRDAEKIEAGMRKAVRLWETSQYWTDRAAGAIRHAKYKELPAVRARRIKGIEADKRKREREIAESEKFLALWQAEGLTLERAKGIANYDHISRAFPLAEFPRNLPASQYEGTMSLWSALDDSIISAEQARAIAIPAHEARIAWARRWVEHFDNRLAYERAMMQESGGIAADRVKPEVGGACRCWCSPGYGKGWSIIQKVNRVSVTLLDNWGNGGKDFTRTIPFDKLHAVLSRAEVEAKRAAGLVAMIEGTNRGAGFGFYLLDEPAKPTLTAQPKPAEDDSAAFEAIKESLRAGVKVVSAPQLFPTPPEIARRVVELADIRPGMRVLEPSAGTGGLLDVLATHAGVIAVEINHALAEALRARYPRCEVRCADFLTVGEELGQFDRVVMNPPFDHGSDIEHIRHAYRMLKPGGRLVAICANGPRQQEVMGEICSAWIELPAGSFKEQGTSVNAAIVVIEV
jgi:SAM-dependent methyltransferase